MMITIDSKYYFVKKEKPKKLICLRFEHYGKYIHRFNSIVMFSCRGVFFLPFHLYLPFTHHPSPQIPFFFHFIKNLSISIRDRDRNKLECIVT